MHRRVLAGMAVLFLACNAIHAQQAPDIQTLLARVRARYDALESLRKSYICTVTQVADEFSANGSKKTHTDEYQAFYVGNTEVLQHTARDGKPLSPEQAGKEQERVDKQVAKLKARQAKASKDEVRLSASGLLKVATFTNGRRETINGRPTLVFDYKGNPDAKAADLSEEIMRRLGGTMWIDERDEAILRLTGRLEENFHVGGGLLVNIRKGSWFDFTQAPVNGEIWFPAEFTAHVDGRFLLVKGFNGDLRATYTDYRKMRTSVTILPGTRVLEESGGAANSGAEPPAGAVPESPPKL
jgi:hypothetical protein